MQSAKIIGENFLALFLVLMISSFPTVQKEFSITHNFL